MKKRCKQFGLTLIEILVSISVVVILVAISLFVVPQVQEKASEYKTREAIEVLNAAMEQYYSFWKDFPFEAGDGHPDANDFDSMTLLSDIGTVNGPNCDEECSIEAAYISLYRTPDCRKALDGIGSFMKASQRTITIDGTEYGILTVVDGWAKPLRILYVEGEDSFPLIESGGADKDFDTVEDNISNRN